MKVFFFAQWWVTERPGGVGAQRPLTARGLGGSARPEGAQTCKGGDSVSHSAHKHKIDGAVKDLNRAHPQPRSAHALIVALEGNQPRRISSQNTSGLPENSKTLRFPECPRPLKLEQMHWVTVDASGAQRDTDKDLNEVSVPLGTNQLRTSRTSDSIQRFRKRFSASTHLLQFSRI